MKLKLYFFRANLPMEAIGTKQPYVVDPCVKLFKHRNMTKSFLKEPATQASLLFMLKQDASLYNRWKSHNSEGQYIIDDKNIHLDRGSWDLQQILNESIVYSIEVDESEVTKINESEYQLKKATMFNIELDLAKYGKAHNVQHVALAGQQLKLFDHKLAPNTPSPPVITVLDLTTLEHPLAEVTKLINDIANFNQKHPGHALGNREIVLKAATTLMEMQILIRDYKTDANKNNDVNNKFLLALLNKATQLEKDSKQEKEIYDSCKKIIGIIIKIADQNEKLQPKRLTGP